MPHSRKKRGDTKRDKTSSHTSSSTSRQDSSEKRQNLKVLMSPVMQKAKELSSKHHPTKEQVGKASGKEAAESSSEMSHEKIDETGSVEYTTILDDIYSKINEHGAITLVELSKSTGITEARLEEWGKIFDKQGMLELYYPFVGGAQLRKKGYEEEIAEKKKQSKEISGKPGSKHNKDDKSAGPAGLATEIGISQENAAAASIQSEAPAKEVKANEVSEGKEKESEPAEGHKAEEAKEEKAPLTPEQLLIEKKKAAKKRMRIITIGLVVFGLAVIILLIYLLFKGGYIKIG